MKFITLFFAFALISPIFAKDKKQYSISYSYLDLESSYFAGSEQYFSGECLEFAYAKKKKGKTFQLIHQLSTSFHSRNDDIINSSRGIKQVYDLSYKLKAGFSFLRLVAGTNAILLNAESFQKGDASLIWGGELTLNPLIIMEFFLLFSILLFFFTLPHLFFYFLFLPLNLF